MSTIYAFDEELAAGSSKLQPTDVMLVHEASTGLKKKLTGALIAGSASGVVDTTATTLAITQASHAGKLITISSASPIAITLPQATGKGDMYRFQMQVAATGTAHTIKVANSTDVMQGVSWVLTTSSANVVGYATSATSDTISLNGTTTAGVVGDIIEISDVKTGFFSVKLFVQATGTTATPFSATV